MNALAKLATKETISEEKDSVGGGNGPLESGLYPAKIALAFLGESKGGAASLTLHLKTDDNRELRQTIYMTSGLAKGQLTYYEKNGEKHFLPGFLLANHLALLTVGKEISDLSTEEKTVNLYNYDLKKEVPTKVQAITELHGQDILAGVLKQTVDKNAQNDAGFYVATGETRDENEIDKFFRARDSMTVAEIRAQAPEAGFASLWATKHTGVTRNKVKGAVAGSGTVGAPAAAAPKKSLFG